MRHTALALMLVTFACKPEPDGPAPGSLELYEPCEYVMDPADEQCAEGLECQGSLNPRTFYCAPGCPTASEDRFSQSPDCPEIDGFVTYCGELSSSLSCIIRCDKSCPDGLGLVCEENLGRCVGQDEP